MGAERKLQAEGPAWIPRPKVCVVTGRTGVGKTKVLEHLCLLKEQVIDLEEMAQHKGPTNPRNPCHLAIIAVYQRGQIVLVP